MPAGLDILNVMRVNQVMQALTDKREMPADLMFNSRIPDVPATEGEIIARMVSRPQIADIIGDDSVAAVYNYGKFTFESVVIPNLKHGRSLNQEQINQLVSFAGPSGLSSADNSAFTMMEANIMDSLLLGIRQRKEALKIAMCLNGMSYNRLGMNLQGVTWGMPSDLNLVVNPAWTDNVNADGISDILNVLLTAQTRYGINYNRVTLSTPAFRYLIAQTKFQNQARVLTPPQLTSIALNYNLLNLGQFKGFAEALTGCQFVLYDSRYWSQDSFGNEASNVYLPINKVIIDSTSNDGDGSCWNFGQVPTTESLIGSEFSVPGLAGRFTGSTRGPIGYATVPHSMNPPNITYWGVDRGWPRKIRQQANAVLTVGTFTDQIPVGDPTLV